MDYFLERRVTDVQSGRGCGEVEYVPYVGHADWAHEVHYCVINTAISDPPTGCTKTQTACKQRNTTNLVIGT